VHWFYNEADDLKNGYMMKYTSKCLSHENIHSVHAGYYWCHGRDVDTGRLFIAKSHIEVIGKWFIIDSIVILRT